MAVSGIHRHPDQGIIKSSIVRPNPQSVEKIKKGYSAFILDLLGKYSLLDGILPIKSSFKICGPVVTCLGADLSIRRMAIDIAQEGDVLLVANKGNISYGCFGDGTALRMKQKGILGCIIDGATRDASRLIELDFPTFVKSTTPRNYFYPNGIEYGSINVNVSCGNTIVKPGDVIFGDADGVVCIPYEIVDEIAEKVESSITDEIIYRENRSKNYLSFDDEYKLKNNFINLGFKFVD